MKRKTVLKAGQVIVCVRSTLETAPQGEKKSIRGDSGSVLDIAELAGTDLGAASNLNDRDSIAASAPRR